MDSAYGGPFYRKDLAWNASNWTRRTRGLSAMDSNGSLLECKKTRHVMMIVFNFYGMVECVSVWSGKMDWEKSRRLKGNLLGKIPVSPHIMGCAKTLNDVLS